MKIAVIGSGYVGLVTAGCLADWGHSVVCVDNDVGKINDLNVGKSLIHEDFLRELLMRHRGAKLTFTTSLADAVHESLAVLIAVGTPPAANGGIDLSYVESVTRAVARCSHGYKLIIEKSTVPVGTSTWVEDIMVLNGCPRGEFDVVSNPEFLREGTAVTDFLYPDRIVVGTNSERARTHLREIYRSLLDGSYARREDAIPKPGNRKVPPLYVETSAQSAELIKHAANAFLAMKISFVNALANVCEAVGGDIQEVCQGIGSDRRIGSLFLRAGIGYGGSCLPKDVAAFRVVGEEYGCQFELLDEVQKINEGQRERFLKKIRIALSTLRHKRLAVLGLAYKDGTDDVRESPAIHVIRSLLLEGCQISAFDPAAMQRAQEVLGDCITYANDAYAAAQNADALLILTDWRCFAKLDLHRLRRILRYPIIVDGRNLYSREEMKKAGLNYYSIGRAPVEIHPTYFHSEGAQGRGRRRSAACSRFRRGLWYPQVAGK